METQKKALFFFCNNCNLRYKTRNGLWKHRKKCCQENNNEEENMKDMFLKMVEQNKELQNIISEQNNKIIELASQPKLIQNINKQENNFNILQYLNNECKDAMNLSEFVTNLKITNNDLLNLRNKGLLDSFRTTFIERLKNMEQNKRPIHCSDKKRKKFYVKDEDVWDKDNNNMKINKAINKVSLKQCETLKKWKISNPYWLNDDSEQEHVNKITQEISKIYDDKEKIKIYNDLTQFSLSKNKNEK
jgi:hypothetical protein